MPYDKTNALPDSVRNALPAHAQEINRSAYNNAWNEYADAGQRRSDESREETAHKVAWSAVKQKYHKESNSDRWVENS